MTHQPDTAVDRIPIGRNVTYAVRGMPEVPNAYGPGFLVPTEISLTYRAAEDSQLGRFHAYVKGQWRRDGELVPSGEKLPGQHYYGDPDGWPAWLAEEARLHDPDASSAGVAPAVWVDGHPQLEAIAAAVWEHCRTEDTSLVVDDPRNIAVAALAAVLPASVDRADDDLATARATNRRLNLRAQRLESELAAYRRAVSQWDVSERGTYVPLRTIAAIAKAAGRNIETPRWLLHYQRVEQAEAAVERVRSVLESEAVVGRSALDYRGIIATALMADGANELRRVAAGPQDSTREPVQHTPGTAILCPDCRAKGHSICVDDRPQAAPGGVWQPSEADCDRVVAYRSALPGALSIYCTSHTDELGDVLPLTSDDLPDGGLCVSCGVDVLIPQQPKEARP